MVWKPDYVELDVQKDYLHIPAADDADDVHVASAITAASRAVDTACGRQFGNVTAAVSRTFEAYWDRHLPTPAWVVEIDDLYDAAGLAVAVHAAGVAITDYQLGPVNALADGMVYEQLVIGPGAARPSASDPAVTLTSDKWGWPAFPVTVVNAAKLQAGRFAKRRDALFGVAGSPSDGSELRLLAKVDPDVAVMLTDYVRWWGAA